MIELLRYRHEDIKRLLINLHPVSRAEIASSTVADPIAMVDRLDEVGNVTSGYTPVGRIVFIAGTRELEPGVRGTLFMFARGFDTIIGFGLRSWATLEKKRFPDNLFIVHSDGDHPLKHRFLKIAGCEHRLGPIFSACS